MASEQKEKSKLQVSPAGLFSSRKLTHSDIAKIKKRVFERLRKREYEGLKRDLSSYRLTAEQISDFFLKEGQQYLKWSLISASPDGPLKLWSEIIPKDAFLSVLSEDNFSILRAFLYTQVELERQGQQSKKGEEYQIKIFNILSSLDDKGIILAFMEKNKNNASIVSEKIINNFYQAIDHDNPSPCGKGQ